MYNPYQALLPSLPAKTFSLSSILTNAQKTLNIVNQTIPIVQEVKPIVKNARTIIKLTSGLKNVNNNINNNVNSNYSKNITENNKTTYNEGPTFYI